MKTIVFGAGAIGSLFGGLLSRVWPVTLVGRKSHVHAIEADGLRIGLGGEISVVHPAVCREVPRDRAFDLAAIAVKAHQTVEACESLQTLGTPPAHLLILQNGIGNEEIIRRYFPEDSLIRAVVYEGATLDRPGNISRHGVGLTFFGRPARPAGAGDMVASDIAKRFSEAGLPVKISRDISREIWRKLVVNAAINPVGAVAGVPNGDLVESPSLRRLLGEVVRETEAVALAETGHPFDLIERTEEIARNTATNKNSMLLDLEAGRATEIDFLGGKIVEFGEKLEIPTPHNRWLTSLIRGREEALGVRPTRSDRFND